MPVGLHNAETSLDRDPPLKVPIKVNYPLQALHRVELKPGEVISIKAELYWAGVKQDKTSKSIEHVYRRGEE